MKINMLFTALVPLALAAGLTQAQAQTRVDFSGTYSITGKFPDGSTYGGQMSVAPYGDGYRVTQTFNDGTVLTGIGNDVGNNLAVAYQWIGDVPSISIYTITQPRTMEGFWQDYDSTKEGGEIALMMSGTPFSVRTSGINTARTDYSGAYTVNGTNPDGSRYAGTMVVSRYGDGYRVTATFGDGSVWRGIATDIGGNFAVAYQTSTGPSVQIYQVDRSGALNGYWQHFNEPREGQEIAVRR